MPGLTPGGTVDLPDDAQSSSNGAPPRCWSGKKPPPEPAKVSYCSHRLSSTVNLDPACFKQRGDAAAVLRGQGITPGGTVDWRRAVAAPKARAPPARRPIDPAKGFANSQIRNSVGVPQNKNVVGVPPYKGSQLPYKM
jgi:hypothetical protein